MRLSLRNTVALLYATGALAQVDIASVEEDDFVGHEDPIVPQQYILEVDAGESLSQVKSLITARGGKVLKTFDSLIFKGLSVQSEVDNVDSLQQADEIVKAWPLTTIKLAPSEPQQVFKEDSAAGNWSVHRYTGVDKAHEAGLFGKGAVVAVIDSGVQYTHEALGGCFGKGCKIAGGYDLVGDGDWPFEPKQPDDDPAESSGHGTHVTGILAGQSDQASPTKPHLIEAFLMAYDDGADIITASVGGSNGFSSNAWAVVASRLVDSGVVVTIAAGNEGSDGPFFGSNGALGPHVIAVASTEAQETPADPFEMTFSQDGHSNTSICAYVPSESPWSVGSRPVIPLANYTSDNDDACEPLGDEIPDLSGSIVLVRPGVYGECGPYHQQMNLADKGVEHMLLYNDKGPFIGVFSWISEPQLGSIERSAAEAIISTVKAGGKVEADFSVHSSQKLGPYNSAGGRPSPFTTWGGSFEGDVKPDVAAPGGNIYSTWPDDSFAVYSGTSMATPYVAGIAALWVGKFGGRNVHGPGWARQLSNRIVASGGSVPWQTIVKEDEDPVDKGYWAPVIQIGTGQIDAWKVLNYTTALTFDNIALNDTRNFKRYHKIQIENTGNADVTYKFALQPAGGVEVQSPYYPWFLTSPLQGLEPVTMVPRVSFPSGTFKVAPGQTKTAQFNFEPPKGLDESKMPVYSGKVLIRSSLGEELAVPYMGLGFNLKENTKQGLFSDTTPYQVGGAGRDNIDIYHSYTFNDSWYEQSFPKVYTELKWGCKELRWDIYEANWPERRWSYPPVPGKNGYIGSATYYRYSAGSWAFNPNTMDREDTISFPVGELTRYSPTYAYRGSFWWMGKLANGSYIEPGNYTIRFAALLPFGNPKNSDNWDIWETPQIQVPRLEI